MKNLTKTLALFGVFLLFFTNLFAQEHDTSQNETYVISSAVEEKSEATFYYPEQISYIGQFWDSSHSTFSFRMRGNLIVEPKKEIGLGYLSTDFGVKKVPIYLSLQGRFNHNTSIWLGTHVFLTDIKLKLVNKGFYQAQIGAYKDLYKEGTLITSYFQTQLIFQHLFFEGFYTYYPKTKKEESRKDFEIEVGFKLTHVLALIAGFEIIENKKTLQAGIRIEMYEHKNKKHAKNLKP
jgi:hypothetical protein